MCTRSRARSASAAAWQVWQVRRATSIRGCEGREGREGSVLAEQPSVRWARSFLRDYVGSNTSVLLAVHERGSGWRARSEQRERRERRERIRLTAIVPWRRLPHSPCSHGRRAGDRAARLLSPS